ncbi:MAG: helix-turn-helix transcriptional regulator [Rubrobacter sp.]|nr:helix-turn-helix transcriptional regulator [Rubrobacter sp.]
MRREWSEFSLEDLSRRTGMEVGQLRSIERNEWTPGLTVLGMISRELGLETHTLIEWDTLWIV